MTTRRSRVPSSLADNKDLFSTLEHLDKRQLSHIADVPTSASTTDLANAINALLAEMRLRKAMAED